MANKKPSVRKKRTQATTRKMPTHAVIPPPRSSVPRTFTTRAAEDAVLHLFRVHPRRSATEQVRNTILTLLRTGLFGPHDRLPSASAIAAQLGVNQAVAVQAYAELIKLDVVRGQERVGYFVGEKEALSAALGTEDLSRAIFHCRQIGMDSEEIEAAFFTALDEHKRFMLRERAQRGANEHNERQKPK